MKIAVLTSVETRHRYFANALRACHDVVAVVYEETGYTPGSTPTLTVEEFRIVKHHFAERARQEEAFFGAAGEFVREGDDRCRVMHLVPKELNTQTTLAFLEGRSSNDSLQGTGGEVQSRTSDHGSSRPSTFDLRPSTAAADTLVVFGTNLIKDPILRRYRGRIINMHLGLSPYYRGTATNFYPLLYGEPEYVGATIHLIDAGIDSGPILAHARPEIVAEDMPHTIGCKAIQAGTDKLIAVLRDFEQGGVQPVPQWKVPNARLCLRKDYHPRQVVELYQKIEAGLIRDYVRRAEHVRGRIRLVE